MTVAIAIVKVLTILINGLNFSFMKVIIMVNFTMIYY